jgi:nitrogen fixation NifU-like protein
MELDSLYQEVILDHYKRPFNKSLSANPLVTVHHINTSCGDEITLSLKLDVNGDLEISWDGVGCSISQASTSIVSELLKGKSSQEALALIEEFQVMILSKGNDRGNENRLEDAVALAGVAKFPARVKCALLGWMASKDAILQVLQRGESKESE